MPIKAILLLTFILKDPVQYYDMDVDKKSWPAGPLDFFYII